MKTLTIILCLALAQCGLSPAWAQTVEVPDIAPAYEEGGPDAGDLAATAVPSLPGSRSCWRFSAS